MKKLIFIISIALFCGSCHTEKKENVVVSTETNTENAEKKTVKMILDLDTGIDDAMALAYALADPQIELIGVVASYGNVTVDESIRNTLSILDMLNHKEVPVFRGADRALGEKETYSVSPIIRMIHGENGIGNTTVATSSRKMEEQDGVSFMIESAKKYGKGLYIVAVGPVTNLDAVIQKEPDFKNQVGKIVIMGGALIVEGNINHYAEANVFHDPVAANNFFVSGTPFTMVGLDITQRTNLTKSDTQKWRDLGTVSGKAYADMVDYYIDAYKISKPDLAGCALHDPLAVAVSVHPDLVKTLSLYMKVGTTKEDWGRTIGEYGKMNDPNPNVEVCVDVKVQEFVDLFKDTLTELFKKN